MVFFGVLLQIMVLLPAAFFLLPFPTVSYTHLLYNVVDSIFVARVSENALTAVSLAFSLQNLMFAVGIGTGAVSYTHLDVYKRQLQTHWASSSTTRS